MDRHKVINNGYYIMLNESKYRQSLCKISQNTLNFIKVII